MNSIWKFSVAVSEKTSDNYPSILRGNFVDTIIEAKSIGFQAVEIHTGNPRSFPWEEVKKVCDSEGMEVSAISSGFSYSLENLSVLSDEPEIRKRARKRFIEYIDLSSHLGCMLILGLMRGPLSDALRYKESAEKLRNYLNEILEYTKEKNVILVLEAINRYENNFIRSVREVVDFVSFIGNPYLKAHIDTYHMNIEESDCVNAVHYARGSLGYVHFSDSNRKIPGFGHIDFFSIARALNRINYRGYITVESIPYPDNSTAAELSLAYLKNLELVISLEEK